MRAMNALCGRLGAHWTRWFGADAWKAVLERALAEGAGTPMVMSLGTGTELHWNDVLSPTGQRKTCVEVLCALVQVLGRFVGDQMALRLTDHGLTPTGGGIEHPDH